MLQAQLQATKQQGRPLSSPRRAAHFGSQTHVGPDRLLVSTEEHLDGVPAPVFCTAAVCLICSCIRSCGKALHLLGMKCVLPRPTGESLSSATSSRVALSWDYVGVQSTS